MPALGMGSVVWGRPQAPASRIADAGESDLENGNRDDAAEVGFVSANFV